MYTTNRNNAATAGLLWGAYHFATGGDGVAQAEHFLQTVGTFDNTLLVLDFEQNPSGTSMSLDDARNFVTHVNQVTGRFPGLYSGSYIKELLGSNQDPARAVLVMVGAVWSNGGDPGQLAHLDHVAIHGWRRRPAATQC
jgi:lysozyme